MVSFLASWFVEWIKINYEFLFEPPAQGMLVFSSCSSYNKHSDLLSMMQVLPILTMVVFTPSVNMYANYYSKKRIHYYASLLWYSASLIRSMPKFNDFIHRKFIFKFPSKPIYCYNYAIWILSICLVRLFIKSVFRSVAPLNRKMFPTFTTLSILSVIFIKCCFFCSLSSNALCVF